MFPLLRSAALGLSAALLLSSAASAEAPRKPNIVFILADDLGIGELGCYGQKLIQTPNIDRLAAEGMRFTQFYCGNAVCAPSRCSLLTGQHMGHAVVRDNRERGPYDEGQAPMPEGTRTVASELHDAGYFTGIIGKWGLGMPDQKSGPNDCGFDYSFGYLCQRVAHTYYPDHLWRNAVSVPLPGNPKTILAPQWQIDPGGETYSHDLLAEDALQFVRDHRAAPFFLYLAFTTPHFSLQVPEDSMAPYQFPEIPYTDKHYAAQPRPHAAYAGMISRMDGAIGRLMAELKTLGLDDNTVVFFSSDNGVTFLVPETLAHFFHSALGYRGMKGDLYEGGIHTSFIARWPGHIQAGSTNDHVGAFWDMLPTFCDLAGAPTPANADGLSIVPTLLGKATEQKRHDWLYWEYHSSGSSQAVRLGDWKGVRTGVKKNHDAPVQLFNLASDPGESTDVAGDHADIVVKIREIMAQRTPSANPLWNF